MRLSRMRTPERFVLVCAALLVVDLVVGWIAWRIAPTPETHAQPQTNGSIR
jgi:hypothetical protein